MMQTNEQWVEVDEKGRLVLPPEVAERYGMQPGAQMLLREGSKGLQLQRPITQLVKVYVEPTSRCNLSCKTCIRNAWDESQGDMANGTFDLILKSIEELPYRPTVFFGGFGEPLLLANIAEMITKAKKVAGKVEIISNGILLTESCAHKLIESGLDTLWVSVDGVTPESYADIRIGAELPKVLDNIRRLAFMRHETNHRPEIGIAFVAMRKNIGDLPALIKKGPALGASRFMVTNVFPYTKEMCGEMLDVFSVDSFESRSSPWTPHIDLPRMDMNEISQEAIFRTLRNRHNVRMNGVSLGQEHGQCPFIDSGAVAIGWNGDVSPCLALMHGYDTFLNEQTRKVRRCIFGNIQEQSLRSIWEAHEYTSFRKRVQEFDFAPCTMCGGCELADTNEEDCFGNTFPTCGGCLWAQGVIKCP